MQDLIRENPITAIGVALLIGVGLLNSGQIKANQQFSAELKAERMAMSQEQARLSAQQQSISAKAAIAEERYKQGCELVVSSADYSKSIAIQQDKPVLDAMSGQPLADGVVVCDVHGTTAVMMGGVASQIAFTGSDAVVNQRIEESRFDAKILKPKQ